MNDAQRKVHQYLLDHPTWHYGLDLVKAGVASRGSVYVALGCLEEAGYAERRDTPPSVPGALPRPQYRATGKRIPAAGDLGAPVPA